jgi:hypothetical protein
VTRLATKSAFDSAKGEECGFDLFCACHAMVKHTGHPTSARNIHVVRSDANWRPLCARQAAIAKRSSAESYNVTIYVIYDLLTRARHTGRLDSLYVPTAQIVEPHHARMCVLSQYEEF